MIARGLGLNLPTAWGEPHSGAVSHQQPSCFFVCTFGPRGKLCNVLSLLNRIKEILTPGTLFYNISIPLYVIMLVCYTTIFATIKRRNNDITRHTRRNTVEKQVVKTILIATIVFTLLWAPMFAFLFSGLMADWEEIVFPLAASSAVFNLFIYRYRNSEYRKAFKRIIFPQWRPSKLFYEVVEFQANHPLSMSRKHLVLADLLS